MIIRKSQIPENINRDITKALIVPRIMQLLGDAA
jgi:hypothetical protein